MNATLPPRAIQKQAELAPQISEAVEDGVSGESAADVVLSDIFRRHREFGSRDRRFFSEMVFSYYRWRGWLKTFNGPSHDPAVCSMAHLLESAQPNPTALHLFKKSSLKGKDPRPIVNLTIEEKAEIVGGWLDCPGDLTLEQLIPTWLTGTLPASDPAYADKLIRSFQQRPPTWLRCTSTSSDDVLRYLQTAGVEVTPHTTLGSALAIPGSTSRGILTAPDAPPFDLQDLASQCIGHLCRAEPGQVWWDACAGAGGKALHLAEQIQGKGLVYATDIRRKAIRELRRRTRKAKFSCIRPRWGDVDTYLPPEAPFDGVLLDAPCSGTGTWARNPDARWRTNLEKVNQHAERQARLLRNVSKGVKLSAPLVYAVCTLTAAETQGVIDAFLREMPSFQLDPVTHPLNGEQTDGIVRIDPWVGPCNGMYITRLKRVA